MPDDRCDLLCLNLEVAEHACGEIASRPRSSSARRIRPRLSGIPLGSPSRRSSPTPTSSASVICPGSWSAPRTSSLITVPPAALGRARRKPARRQNGHVLADRARAHAARRHPRGARRRVSELVVSPAVPRPRPAPRRSGSRRAQGEGALLAEPRLDGARRRDSDRRGHTRRLGRADRLRHRLGDRGHRERRDHLAVHRRPDLSHAAEERAQKLVAIQFFLLAPYVAFEAIQALVNAEHPEISGSGWRSPHRA